MADDGAIRSEPSKQESRACGHCGKSFRPTHRDTNRQKFCSSVCKSEFHSIRSGRAKSLALAVARGTRDCRFCGKEFSPLKPNGEHCSRSCSSKTSSAKSRARIAAQRVEKSCKSCGNSFKEGRRVSAFCSRACSDTFYNREQHKKIATSRALARTSRACLKCNETFTPVNRNDQRFCSKRCTDAWLQYQYWNTPRGKLRNAVCCAVRRAVVKGSKTGRRTFDLLGYSVEDLRSHLERQFKDGMSWDNYGQWHIDHVIPLDFFQFETPDCEGFKLAWRMRNLQPLWKRDNIVKSNKLPQPLELQTILGELANGH